LDHQDVAADRGEAGLQGPSLAAIALMKNRPDRDGRRPEVRGEDEVALIVDIDGRSAARSFGEIGLHHSRVPSFERSSTTMISLLTVGKLRATATRIVPSVLRSL
jgi:hypothetical protein